MRILLTTYGPFRDVKENITEKVADGIQKGWDHKRGELVVLNLPVEWRDAEILLTHALEELKPDVAVSMGHAEKYPAITIETRYFNIAEGADNQGEKCRGGVIVPDGADFYDTNCDITMLASFLEKNNVPAVLHTGKEGMTYLCNFAGHVVMQHIRSHQQQKPLFIFLHLPPDAIPFDELVRGVTKVLDFLTENSRSGLRAKTFARRMFARPRFRGNFGKARP
ncbi:MAG: hypothetical protein Q7S52_00065 [bacterium]|nr:hypothetical protein [bacterium]